ncbi:MAG: hypothetical protein M0T71_12225 [Actinomycetota bacterium]|nr:hypothetical protein [Actinomycetota bacterium]
MSSRHRREARKPPPSERRVHHHRERQAVRHALDASDPEDLLDPRSRHNLHDEHAGSLRPGPAPRRFRHWKAPFWKRRNAVRHERNVALASFAASDPAG